MASASFTPANELAMPLDGNEAFQRIVTRIGEHLPALSTLVALAIFTLSEFPAVCPAALTGHCESP